MTSPDSVYEVFKDATGLPVWTQDPLDFDGPPIFPTVDIEGGLMVPLTKYPSSPTNGQKMVPVMAPKDCEPGTFKSVLSGAFQSYLSNGRLIRDDVARVSGVPVATVRSIMETEEFGYAMALRGVDTKGVGTLTPQQDAALMILTDIGSRRNWGQRLSDAGISQAVFSAWMKNPTFARRFSGISEEITANHGVALVELGRKVGEGDFNAIKFQLEVSGRYSSAQQAQVDVMLMMNKIMESLSIHLAGKPEVLRAVAKDMLALAETVSQQKVITAESTYKEN